MKTLKAILYQSGLLFGHQDIQDGEISFTTHGNSFDTFRNWYDKKHWFKIVAQHNLSLEGIPYVELEEDVKAIAGKHCYSNSEVVGFIKGYKAAQPKKYTEDDLRKAFKAGEICYQCDGNEGTDENTYIESLQPKIESIEVETKGTISNYVAKEIPITYQKDGKTYLKIKKINYDTTRS